MLPKFHPDVRTLVEKMDSRDTGTAGSMTALLLMHPERFRMVMAVLAVAGGFEQIKFIREGEGGLDEATLTPHPETDTGYAYTDFSNTIPGIESTD